MGKWVMCSLHGHEDLSLNPLHSSRNQVLSYMPVTPALGVQDKRVTKSHWPANLSKSVSCRMSERLGHKNSSGERYKSIIEINLWPPYAPFR